MEHGNVGPLQALQHVLRFHTLQAVMHRIVSYTPHCLNYTRLPHTVSPAARTASHTSQLAAALSVQSSVPEHISTQTSIIHKKYTTIVLYSAFVKLAPEAQMGLRSHTTGRGPTVALPWLFLDLFRPLVHFGALSTHGRSQAQAFPHAP